VCRLHIRRDVARGFTAPVVLGVLLLLPPADLRPPEAQQNDPFSFFGSSIRVSPEERRKLDEGDVLTKTLPAHGHEIALFTAGSISTTPEALANSVRGIAELKKGPLVPQIGRFSSPPTAADLASLTLDDADLKAIKHCRPRGCDLKLSGAEIARLQAAPAANPEIWKSETEKTFRQILLERVTAYLGQGQAGIPQYESGDDDADLTSTFAALLQSSPYLRANLPQVGEYFERYPAFHVRGMESFLYWSKEKPPRNSIISVTHVTILRSDPDVVSPEVIVASKEVFATRYTSGALALTLLLHSTNGPPRRYLAYVNRTWVDDLRSLWRPIVEWRVRSQASKAFAVARQRIELK
jgi:hypothetical protein